MRVEDVELVSPPVKDLGAVTKSMLSDLASIAADLQPEGQRLGQVAAQVIIGKRAHRRHRLHELALVVGEALLGEKPGRGTDVRLKHVTDADAYRTDTNRVGAAQVWHHDYELTQEEGFALLDKTTRVIIPTEVGPQYAAGTLRFPNARVVGPVEALQIGQAGLLASADPIIIGEGGVLVKSAIDPTGGTISQAAPDRAYVIPKDTAHKADSELPTGRMLFRMDHRPRRRARVFV